MHTHTILVILAKKAMAMDRIIAMLNRLLVALVRHMNRLLVVLQVRLICSI